MESSNPAERTASTFQEASDVRPATREDKRAIFTAAKQLATRMYSHLRADVAKISEIIDTAIRDSRHYARVVGPAGDPTACLIAITAPLFWAQRNASHIVLWHSEVAGQGGSLLQDYSAWVLQNSRSIRVAGWQPDVPLHAGLARKLESHGFTARGGAFLLYTREQRQPLAEQARRKPHGISK